jgi:hypothetical protein
MGLFYIRVNMKALVTGSIVGDGYGYGYGYDCERAYFTWLYSSGSQMRDEAIFTWPLELVESQPQPLRYPEGLNVYICMHVYIGCFDVPFLLEKWQE